MTQRPSDHSRRPLLRRLSEDVTTASLGLEVGLSVAIGALVGYWLDGRLGTSPWMTVVWLIFGVGAATKRILQVLRKLAEHEEQGEEGREGERHADDR